jgi:Mn-dependent DtxR family transcriptional regulator
MVLDNPLQTMEVTGDELDRLSALLHAFSQKTRLAILLGLHHGFSPPEIADAVGVSRPGLQSHLEQMRQQRLLRRNASGGYMLTPLGEWFAEFLDEHRDMLLNIVEYLEQVETEVEDELKESVLREEVSESDWERLVAGRVWEQAAEPVTEQLDGADEVSTEDISDEAAKHAERLGRDKSDVCVFSPIAQDNGGRSIREQFEQQFPPEESPELYEKIEVAELDALFRRTDEIEQGINITLEYDDQVLVITSESLQSDRHAGEATGFEHEESM